MIQPRLSYPIALLTLGLATACAPDAPVIEETLVIGQMLRGGQTADGDSFLSFDVMLTERGNGPAIDCTDGRLSVELEVSTDRGRRFVPVRSDHLNVLCEASVGPDIALVVDNSGSQEGQLNAIVDATSQLANDIHEMGGRTSIVRVSTEARVVHDLSSDSTAVAAAISDFHVSNGWTALYDGIRLGNETLGRAVVPEDEARFGSADEFCGIDPRRAIVVFTDGKENNSSDEHATEDYPGDGVATTFEDVKQLKVRGTNTPVYTIGLGDEVDHQELNRLGNKSGGKHHAVSSLDELADTFRNVAGYSDRRFRVCGDLGVNHCGRLDVRMSYSWTDGGRTLEGSDEKTITVPCAEGPNSQPQGRSATLLMALSNPGLEESVASELVVGAVDWVAPVAKPKVLVVLDDFHHNESPEDAQYVVALLEQAGVDVSYLEEPEPGIDADDVAGYDVVWLSNPGYPMDDELSFTTLRQLLSAGKGVVLQGDDMASSHGQSFDMSPITHLSFEHNGTSSCGVTTDNNTGNGAYAVSHGAHDLLAGSSGKSYRYADDIDWTKPKGDGEQVLAWGTVISRDNGRAQCNGNSGRVPVVVAFDPNAK